MEKSERLSFKFKSRCHGEVQARIEPEKKSVDSFTIVLITTGLTTVEQVMRNERLLPGSRVITPFFRMRRKCAVMALGLRKPNCRNFLGCRHGAVGLLLLPVKIKNLLSSGHINNSVYLDTITARPDVKQELFTLHRPSALNFSHAGSAGTNQRPAVVLCGL
jgi:hypothetical protein